MAGRLSAVIFDMDGVLIDSEPLHYAVLRNLLAGAGITYTLQDNEQFLGTTTEDMFSTLIARHRLPRRLAEYRDAYDAGILQILREPHVPQPGVRELIVRLRERGVRVAVASSSRRPWIEATLRSIQLADAFEVVVSGDDVTHGKPNPEIYLLAARRLGLAPEACVAIEDAPNGVAAARAAGMRVIGVRTPYTAHLALDGAERVVDSLDEVLGPDSVLDLIA